MPDGNLKRSARDLSLAASGASLKPSAVLAAAADLIEPKGRWTRNWTARRRNAQDPTITESTVATDPRAVEWGAVGAIYKIGMDAGLTPPECFAIQAIAARANGCPRVWFSDWAWAAERTQPEVVAALRKGAEFAKSEGQ